MKRPVLYPILPLWLRTTAAVLLPVYLLTSIPVPLMAQQPAAMPPVLLAPPSPLTKSVPTRTDVRPNKKPVTVLRPAAKLRFSSNAGTEELQKVHVLPDALVVGGAPSNEENRALAAALLAHQNRKGRGTGSLDAYVSRFPDSPWVVSLDLNLGILAYHEGRFSEAITYWEQAWAKGKDLSDAALKPQVDRAFGELVRMHARIGNMSRLKELFDELGSRNLTGSATELVQNSREGLWMMENQPEISFRCGPFALGSIVQYRDPSKPIPQEVQDSASPQKGFALSEVATLAGKVGLDCQMAKWEDRNVSVPPVPSVIHWKVGHYAALLKQENGLWLVRDPTFGEDLWVSLETLKQEASGYFLVPAGKLPRGWKSVDNAEAAAVYGKGNTGNKDTDCVTPIDQKCPTCPPAEESPKGQPASSSSEESAGDSTGMAAATAHFMLVSLNIQDVPLRYAPPKGQTIKFRLTYNQREAGQPATFTYSNVGPKWTYNWLSYVIDNPASTSANVKVFTKGGGAYAFTGFNTGTQTFAFESKSQSILKRTGTSSYERTFNDGSKQIFDLSDGATGAGRKVFLTEEIDPAGNSVTYTYDMSYRLVSVTDALGQVTTLSYDHPTDSLKITKVTDPFGRYTTLEYDGSGRLEKITDVIGITSEFTYGANDFITSLITPYGTSTFSYGEEGTARWLNMTDPQGDTQRVEFRHGITISESASAVPSGQGLTTSYREYRNVFYWDKKAWKLAPGDYTKARLIHFLHKYGDANTCSGTVESTKNPYENRVWYTYAGQSSSVYQGTSEQPAKIMRNLDGGTSDLQMYQYAYNGAGNVTSATDPLGRVTTYVYDTNNIDILEVRQKTGASTYDVIASATYNSQHLPLTVTDMAGETTTYTYNAAGQVTSVENALGETTTFTYDTDGYLTDIDGPASGTGDTTSFTYDSYGRVRTATDSEGYGLTYDYDDFDRVTKVTYPDSTYEQVIYNKLDAEWFRDREGRWSRSFHNKIRQIVATQDPLGQLTQFEWCKCGRLQGLTDPMGRVTKWAYDEQGRLLSKTYPDSTQQTYAYETTIVRLKSMTDAKGQRTNYEYFKDNRPKKISYTNTSGGALSPATPSVEWTYDANYGRPATMIDGTGTTSYAYHAAAATGGGRLATVDGPLTSDTIAYTYDELGRVSGRSINSVAQSVSYDVLGRVEEVINPLGTFDYTYVNYTGRLDTITNPNGQTATFDYYNNAGGQRLKQIKHETSTPDLISQFDYEYSPTGNITKWTRTLGSAAPQAWAIVQDASDRLTNIRITESSTPVKEYAYTYDKAGNRLTEQVDQNVNTASYNNLNQLTARSAGGWMRFEGTLDEPATVTVDGNDAYVDGSNKFTGYAEVTTGTNTVTIAATDGSSNTTSQDYEVTVPTGAGKTLSYDLNGNLTSVSSASSVVNYAWDAANRLTKITYSDSSTSEFTYDGYGRRVRIVEKNNMAATTSDLRYVWADGSQPAEERNAAGDTVLKHYYGQGVYIPAATSPADKLFYTRDHLGSIRELVDNSEAVVARYSYDPWGRRTKVSGSADADFGYTGHYQHAKSNLTLTWYRAYDADLGRWLSRDPIEEDGGVNLYAYVKNDAVNYDDPDGLFPLSKLSKKGIVRILRTKTAHLLIAKSKNVIAGSKKEATRAIEKVFPNKKAVYHTTDSTSQKYGPHAQPNPRKGNQTHVFDGSKTSINALRKVAKSVTAAAYLDTADPANAEFVEVVDFINPLSIGQDAFDIIDAFDEAWNSAEDDCP